MKPRDGDLAVETPAETAFPEVPEIERAWGIQVTRRRPSPLGHGAQLRISDGEGRQWYLKHVRAKQFDPGRFDFCMSALESAGAALAPAAIPEVRRTHPGDFQWPGVEGGFFYLLEEAPGRRASHAKRADTGRVLAALAALHRGSAGLATDAGRDARAFLQKRAGAVRAMLNTSGEAGRHGFVSEYAIKLGLRCDPLLEALTEFSRRAVTGEAGGRIPPVIIHGDAHANNYLLDSDGVRVWLLDLESMKLGCGVEDLEIPLHRFGMSRRWNRREMFRIIEFYEKARPLDHAERMLLGGLLAYPSQWMRLAKALARKPRGDIGTLRKLARFRWSIRGHIRFAEELLRRWE